jgi:hypothetical protein
MVKTAPDAKKDALQQRIRKLKEMEEQKKKEIAKAEIEIKESMDELDRDEKLAEIEVPQAQEIDITKLFREESPEPKKKKLEELEEVKEIKQTEDIVRNYLSELYELKENGYGKIAEAAKRTEEIYHTLNAIRDHYQLSDSASEMLNTSRRVAYEMKKYKRVL